MPSNPKRVLRPKEAAEWLGCSVNFLEKLRCYGGGPRFIRVGKRTLGYDIEDLQAWLESKKVANTTEAGRG